MSKQAKNAAAKKNATTVVGTGKIQRKKNVEKQVEQAPTQAAPVSTITIQTTAAKEDAKQVEQAPQYKSSNASSKRITIFNKSLTSVVKAFCKQLDLSVADAIAVTARLASAPTYARSSVTTAMSDAKNPKYAKVVAVLTDDEVKTVRQTLEAIAKEAKQAAAK